MSYEVLETNNLILRKAKTTDLYNIWNNIWKDKHIAESMLWEPIKDIESAKLRLNRTIEYHHKNYAYFVCLKSTDEAIGFAGIKEKEKGIFEESGICIAKQYQGNGYAKEIVDTLKKLIFEKLEGDRFLYGCFASNERSRRVCISQGFKYLKSDQIIREWDKKQFTVDYYYFDKEMYIKE